MACPRNTSSKVELVLALDSPGSQFRALSTLVSQKVVFLFFKLLKIQKILSGTWINISVFNRCIFY